MQNLDTFHCCPTIVLLIKLVASGGTQWLCHWTLKHIYPHACS